MAKKLKSPRFGRQLFKKKSINSNQGGIDADNADDQSTTSSLNSDLSRSHGPIDVDNCTSGKHNSKTRHMFNGGSRRSRSKSNEQKSRNTLTKIVESRNNSPTQSSTSSSSSKQQHDENIDGSNHSKKSIDTDCHGKDVFERSRSDMSHMLSSTSRTAGGGRGGEKNTSSPTSHRTDSPNGSTDTPNGEETSASSSNGSSSNNSSPSNSNNTRSPSSMSPFSLQLSNFPLFGRSSSLVSPRSAARDVAARKGEEDTQQRKQSDTPPGDTKTCQQKEPSPTSVLQLIVDESSGSSTLPAYPVEFNTTLSNGGDNNNDGDDNSSGRYSITEYKGDKYDTDSSTLPLSLSPTKSSIISPKRSSPSSSSASSSMSKVFNKFWEGSTSSNYTSLEDAIDTHHESLLAPPTPPEEEDTTMKKHENEEVAVTHAMELVKSNKDFLSLKKDTEKNEFINNKNVQSLTQRSSSTPIRVVLPPSTKDTTAITASGSNSMGSSQLLHECKKNKKMLWTLGMGMRRSSSLTNNRRPSDFEDTTSSMTTNLLDGTGTSSSRSRSSSPSINIPDSTQMGEPASPNAFPQDILVGSPRGSSSSQGQQQVATESNNKNVTVDNIVESFSFDNQDFLNDMGLGAFPTSAAGVQQQQNSPNIDLDSLSSEEESYLSNEIEDIDSITICEETERMINEHKAYVDSVKSNSCHPSRSIPSIMKVSLATAGSMECSIQTEAEAGGESKKEEQARIKTSRLTWYDDEVNWTKPFTLRTDESFDESTMTSGRYSSTNNNRSSTAIVGVNQWMDGIMKGMICGGEEDVESYDVGSDQQEI